MKKQKLLLSPQWILRKVLRDMEAHQKIQSEMEANFRKEWEKCGIRSKGRN